jgi:AraC-like DNA-binding protein
MSNSPTIKDAIEILCRYFNLMNDINSPVFSLNKNKACLSIRFHTDTPTRTRHIHEGILAAYASLLLRLSENNIVFDGIYFVHDKPADTDEHQRIFNAPLFFNQKKNKIEFKKKYLNLPIRLSNSEIFETLEILAQKLQKKIYSYGPWSDRVSKVVIDLLNGGKPEIETIAQKLAISPRNLQRHLKNEGTSYRKLFDYVRKEKAIYFFGKNGCSDRGNCFSFGIFRAECL